MTSTALVSLEDDAARQAGDRKTSRVLMFPDGLARHVMVKARNWDNWDTMLDRGWPEAALISVAYDTAIKYAAQEGIEFEAELRHQMDGLTAQLWEWRDGRGRNVANHDQGA